MAAAAGQGGGGIKVRDAHKRWVTQGSIKPMAHWLESRVPVAPTAILADSSRAAWLSPPATPSRREGIEETLSYYAFPSEHWRSIRTNNPQERIMREIRRRTRVVGAFPDGRSALMLVAARLRHIANSTWGKRRYLDMSRLKEVAAAGAG